MTSPTFLPRAGETGSDGVLTLRTLPSVDALLNLPERQDAIALHGRALVKRAIQSALAGLRKSLAAAANAPDAGVAATREQLMRLIDGQIAADTLPSLRRVFNLTGTVIHTNLGRSPLPEAAVAALVQAARHPVTIEYDLAAGERADHAAQDGAEGLVTATCDRITGKAAGDCADDRAADPEGGGEPGRRHRRERARGDLEPRQVGQEGTACRHGFQARRTI